ncbi:MAG: hypothetical protein COA32_06785 [Fluviicola sp.]|nr:MAG: hypothetical protein COA32_06785 [Fluviicola sp.]
MMKLLSIFIVGILLIVGNPISELKVNLPPTEEEARKLNHSNEEYEVFLNSKGNVEYREYEYGRIKGTELPFKITPKKEDAYDFVGRQVNLKIENGWLVGFDKGEWGGSLFWFNEKGTQYEKITSGNIKNLFKINGEIYVTEGLAHLSLSSGQIFTVKSLDGKWSVDKKVDLPNAPYATTLTAASEFLIVTSKGLLKVDKNFNTETLIDEGLWWGLLYPNSILIEGQTIYIGMRAGILKTQINDIHKQEWLTKK